MKDWTLGIVVWVKNALAQGEEGTWYEGPSGFLGILVAVLAVIALGIYIYTHTSVSK